jgi:hypothetical protein
MAVRHRSILDYLFSAGLTKTYEQMKDEIPGMVIHVLGVLSFSILLFIDREISSQIRVVKLLVFW